MTLIELSIASAVMLVVLATLVGILSSVTRNDALQQSRIVNQEQVRQTMLTMSREIRSANPAVVQSDSTAYATAFESVLGTTGGTQTDFLWRLSGTTLVREVLDSQGGNVVTTATVLNNVTSSPLFQYFDEHGNEITSPQYASDYVNCAIRIRINVTAAPDTGSSPFTEVSDVELRNRLPGGIGC